MLLRKLFGNWRHTLREDIKIKWLKALRSGEYEQTSGYLSKNNRYCCLGVLCELAAKEGVAEKTTDPYYSYYGKEQDCRFLPAEVIDWAQISRTGMFVKYNDLIQHLPDLNDRGTTFIEIADIIEEYL